MWGTFEKYHIDSFIIHLIKPDNRNIHEDGGQQCLEQCVLGKRDMMENILFILDRVCRIRQRYEHVTLPITSWSIRLSRQKELSVKEYGACFQRKYHCTQHSVRPSETNQCRDSVIVNGSRNWHHTRLSTGRPMHGFVSWHVVLSPGNFWGRDLQERNVDA